MDLKSYQAGRTDGLQLALRLVKEGGQEALEKEIKFRNQYGIHTTMTEKELEKASVAIKEMTIDTVTIMALHTLHDEFGFGPSRADRFVNRFNEKVECILDGLFTWEDLIHQNAVELGIDKKIRMNGV